MDLSATITDILNKAAAVDSNSCEPGSKKYPLCATIYGYAPSLAWNGLFLSIFALSTLVHFCQGTYYRMWTFIVAMCLGGLCEVIGESLLSSQTITFNLVQHTACRPIQTLTYQHQMKSAD